MTSILSTIASGRCARVALGLALIFGATAVQAQPQTQIDVNALRASGGEARTRVVSISDINLATPKGQQTLDTRLRVVAGEVCGKRSLWSIRVPADYTDCYTAALSAARAQLGDRTAMADGLIRVASN